MHPVKVKRDGPRGWHWVASFDPEKHELYIDPVDAKPSTRGRKKAVG